MCQAQSEAHGLPFGDGREKKASYIVYLLQHVVGLGDFLQHVVGLGDFLQHDVKFTLGNFVLCLGLHHTGQDRFACKY